jgi:hypothetical protein
MEKKKLNMAQKYRKRKKLIFYIILLNCKIQRDRHKNSVENSCIYLSTKNHNWDSLLTDKWPNKFKPNSSKEKKMWEIETQKKNSIKFNSAQFK